MACVTAVVGLATDPEHYTENLRFFDTAAHRFSHFGRALRSVGVDFRLFANTAFYETCKAVVGDASFVHYRMILDLDEVFDGTDFLVVWNGSTEHELTSEATTRGVEVLYCELGWLPQRNTLAFDLEGAGPKSSFVNLSEADLFNNDLAQYIYPCLSLYLQSQDGSPVVEAPPSTIFVPLQLEQDSNMEVSPFSVMQDFVDWLALFPKGYIFAVRPHPLDRDKTRLKLPGNCVLAEEGTSGSWLARCERVLGLNSTVLIEALAWRRGVVSLAKNVGWNKGVYLAEGALEVGDVCSAFERSPNQGAILNFLAELVYRRQISMYDLSNLKAISNSPALSTILRSRVT